MHTHTYTRAHAQRRTHTAKAHTYGCSDARESQINQRGREWVFNLGEAKILAGSGGDSMRPPEVGTEAQALLPRGM